VDIKHNFLSIITLGSFNPAILTPDFLKEQGIWTAEEPPRGTSSPVVSNLKFGDVSFSAELERFQVMHRGIEDFKDSTIVDATYEYLEVLKYTPLFVQGINFNVTLLNYKDDKGIKAVFEDPITGLAKYAEKTDEYLIDIRTKVTKAEREVQTINCKYYIDSGLSVSINLQRLNEEINLNFNQEVENIRDDRGRVRIIYDNYQKIYKRFATLLEDIRK
jgi:hypothetical protein